MIRGRPEQALYTLSWPSKALNAFLSRQEMQISNGYGDFKDKAFRIAHMGEVNDDDMTRLFSAIETYLSENP